MHSIKRDDDFIKINAGFKWFWKMVDLSRYIEIIQISGKFGGYWLTKKNKIDQKSRRHWLTL